MSAPGLATAVTAVAGAKSAVVSFTAPANDGGSPVTGYDVLTSAGTSLVSGTASPITVTDLTGGASISFKVVAKNALGSGPSSLASAPVIPYGEPGAPMATTVIPKAGQQVLVSFRPPTSNGGSIITSYTVTSSPDGITATGTASPILVKGLTAGTSYTFSITATNAGGTSIPSAPTAAVISL